MKKNYIFTLLSLIVISVSSFGQELLLNGNFESWDDDTTPTSWSKAESVTKDDSEKNGGSFSVLRNGGSGTKDLAQTILGVTPGNSYTITIWYKVTSGDDTDARIWSYWKDDSNTNIDNDDFDTDTALRGPDNGYLSNNGNVWSQYTVTITAPAGAASFYFEVRSYNNSVVNWDDFSFVANATATISESPIKGFSAFPNPVTNKQLTISSESSGVKKATIYNILGRKVFSESFSGTSKLVQVDRLTKGIYVLKVSEGFFVSTKKLVIH